MFFVNKLTYYTSFVIIEYFKKSYICISKIKIIKQSDNERVR